MKKIIISLCFFLSLISVLYSEEPKPNEVIVVNGERLINHGVHTWVDTENESVLVCKFCGETWELTRADKIKLGYARFKRNLPFRLEIVIPSIVGVLIIGLIIFAYVKSYVDDNKRFKLKAEALKEYIRKDAAARHLDKYQIETLLRREIRNRADYEEIEFIYDKGHLRSKEEIYAYQYNRRYNDFNNSRHIVNFLAYVIPFIIAFIITNVVCDLWIFGIPLGILFGLMASLVGTIIGYSINICNADIKGIPDDDPCVIEERQKRKMAIISGLVAGYSIGKNTKKAIKDITNVDGWKKMK